MSLDKIINHIIETCQKEERRTKAMRLSEFKFERSARDLIEPSKRCAEYHRSREEHYTKELENAERNLKENGISVEVYDSRSNTYYGCTGSIVSGAMAGTSMLQPRVDQKCMDAVKNAKEKMIEHRDLATKYEKYIRAFTCAPESKIELGVEDVNFFRLKG
jgi:hypothetical protein